LKRDGLNIRGQRSRKPERVEKRGFTSTQRLNSRCRTVRDCITDKVTTEKENERRWYELPYLTRGRRVGVGGRKECWRLKSFGEKEGEVRLKKEGSGWLR